MSAHPKAFDSKNYPWQSDIDYRKNPDHYQVGKGEQGVLLCEPYKGEILKNWRFKTPEIATESSELIYQQFLAYLENDDFVGADMARKFLQMGFTRARRYTNYKGGQKYDKESHALLEKGTGDPLKAKSAEIFYQVWQQAEANEKYKRLKAEWKNREHDAK